MGSVSANHVVNVDSLSASLRRFDTSVHSDSALSSAGRCTPGCCSLRQTPGSGDHSNGAEPAQRLKTCGSSTKKSLLSRYIPPFHSSLHSCGKMGRGLAPCGIRPVDFAAEEICARCVSGGPPVSLTGGPGRLLLYTGAVAGTRRPFTPTSSSQLRETHFPAERSTPEAPARIPRADVDPRRPRDPQAPSRQGAQASLGLSRVETPPPPFPLTRLRRRLPARSLDGHALSRPLRF